MIPWKLLDTAQTPGHGAELCLYQRGTEFSIKAGDYELMNSHIYGSEDALANLACQKITKLTRARVLIGGLGMGYTVRSALNGLGAKAHVVVAELVPAVVQWNLGILAHLAGSPLDDDRVSIHETDVAQLIKIAKGDYDAILLDVDNGPQALVREANDWLYSLPGLKTAFAALRPKGVLAIWSSVAEPAFARRLRKTGFEVDEVGVRAREGRKGGAHHIVYIAMRI
ncbi:MAG: spermidine synthase [Chloroflexi bacterium]|nr:spermidine synthase [Chloroflexota bacterium]MCI0793098.1 spermidine synthase [Chloroflexota bacterium]MCI0878518.1 spermidine synthase [Chloroflexota bacterium]